MTPDHAETDGQLTSLCAQTVVAITVGDELVGSGVFISARQVLTCAHVVQGDGPFKVETDGSVYTEVTVIASLPEYNVAQDDVWPLPDLALIRIDDRQVADHPCALLGPASNSSGTSLALGMQQVGAIRLTKQISTGETLREISVSGETVLSCRADGIKAGMSGGALLNVTEGVVYGLIKTRVRDGATNNNVICISSEMIQKAFPEVWEQNQIYHESDHSWTDCVPFAGQGTQEHSWLERYLSGAAEADNRPSPLIPADVARKDLRQPIRVIPLRGSLQAQPKLGTRSDSSTADDPPSDDASFIWTAGNAPNGVVGIISPPGSGKSWLLAHHTAEQARTSLSRLAQNRQAWRTIPIPLFVDASELARMLDTDPSPEDVAAALVRTLRRGHPELGMEAATGIVNEAIVRRSLSPNIDALDEVPANLRIALTQALRMIQTWSKTLVIAGRPSVEQLMSEVLPEGLVKYSIAPFSPGDINRFVPRWFSTDPRASEDVLETLRGAAYLRDLAQTPLLLTCICRLRSESYEKLPKTRAHLLREVLILLLGTPWRGDAGDTDVTNDVQGRLSALGAAACELASGWRGRPEDFGRAELIAALKRRDNYRELTGLALERWRSMRATKSDQVEPSDPLLWEFVHDGVLFERGSGPHKSRLRFLHTLFLEVAIAIYLAQLDADEVNQIISPHLWFDSSWSEIIVMSIGLRSKLDLFSIGLPDFERDVWGEQARLGVGGLVERGVEAQDEAAKGLAAHLLEVLDADGDPKARLRAGDDLGRLITGVGASVRDLVASRLFGQDGKFTVATGREPIASVVFALAHRGSVPALEFCRKVLEDETGSIERSLRASLAVCAAQDRAGLELIVKELGRREYPDQYRQRLATMLSTAWGRPATIAREILNDSTVEASIRRVITLGLVSSGGDSEALVLQDVVNDRLSHELQCESIVALLSVGSQECIPTAYQLLSNPALSRTNRVRLSGALLRRGERAVLGQVRELVVDRHADYLERRRLAQILVRIGEAGLDVLASAATSSRYDVYSRLQSILALVDVGDPRGIDVAIMELKSGQPQGWLQRELALGLLRHSPSLLNASEYSAIVKLRDDSPAAEHMRLQMLVSATILGHADLAEVGWAGLEPILVDMSAGPEASRLIDLMGQKGAVGGEALSVIVTRGDLSPALRARALLWLAVVDPKRASEWLYLLEQDIFDEWTRSRLVVALCGLGLPSTFQRCLELAPRHPGAFRAVAQFLWSANAKWSDVSLALDTLRGMAVPPWPGESDPQAWFEIPSFDSIVPAEEQLRRKWFHETVLKRSLWRAESLLMPTETFDHYITVRAEDDLRWRSLTEFIPNVQEIVQAEAAQLLAAIADDPAVMPSAADTGSAFQDLVMVGQVLDNLDRAIAGSEWTLAASIVSTYGSMLKIPPAHDMASWALSRPLSQSETSLSAMLVLYLVRRIMSGEKMGKLEAALRDPELTREAIAHLADEGNGLDVHLGAAHYILAEPESAVGYFYSGLGAALAGDGELARHQIGLSAERASVTQAIHGAKTLRDTASLRPVEPGLLLELVAILDAVGASQNLGPSDSRGGHDDPEEDFGGANVSGEAS